MNTWPSPKQIAALTFVAWSTAAATASASNLAAEGVYKHLVYIEEAGDLLGMAVNVKTGANPTITVTTCEGGCYGGKEWPLQMDRDNVSFTVCDALLAGHGEPAACDPVHYAGKFRRDGALVVLVLGQPDSRLVLKRVRHPKAREVESLACSGNGC